RRGGAQPAPRGAPSPVDLTKPNFFLIRLRGPLMEEWRAQLRDLGVDLLEYIPLHNYTAKLTMDEATAVRALSFVDGVRLYDAGDSGQPASTARARAAVPSPGGNQMITYDARLHREEDMPAVLAWLDERGVNVAGSSGRKVRLYLLEQDDLADELADLIEVAEVQEYVAPKLHNDVARVLLGIDRRSGTDARAQISQTGEGQIVGVADTGLDEAHPDFQGRIVGVVPLGRPNDASDPHGHGTHVAGSVLGDGAASQGAIRGTAPEAELFFQSVMDVQGGLGGLPLNLEDLFEEAYQAGARIHNNSWGSATEAAYVFNSMEVDEFVSKRRDMLIVISAGNEGQAESRFHSERGFVDWLSIGSPATAKNAVTVGASRTSRTSGGLSQLTHDEAFSGFPDPPIAIEKVSGDPQGLAGFSSRGPSDDRRIKPDVVAPGTDIASAKSSRAPLRNFWGPYPGNSRYAFMGGTSMSAPLVSGCAALIREYYVKDIDHAPSAALLKATLINSTRLLTAADALADHAQLPNYHQGFGSVHMPWAIPNPSEPDLRLNFLDTLQDQALQFTRSGQRFRFSFTSNGNRPLRLCLTWTDLPGRAVQNNLNLFLQLPSGAKVSGNTNLPQKLTRLDRDNNIETIRLENPTPGNYLIQIAAKSLLRGPQDFALVVTGDLESPLTEF
ncbi:MAG: S8 family serine peptidase, partial [Anaerolineae bacterium]